MTPAQEGFAVGVIYGCIVTGIVLLVVLAVIV